MSRRRGKSQEPVSTSRAMAWLGSPNVVYLCHVPEVPPEATKRLRQEVAREVVRRLRRHRKRGRIDVYPPFGSVLEQPIGGPRPCLRLYSGGRITGEWADLLTAADRYPPAWAEAVEAVEEAGAAGMSVRDLAEAIRRSTTTTRRAVQRMVADGLAVRAPASHRGGPTVWAAQHAAAAAAAAQGAP